MSPRSAQPRPPRSILLLVREPGRRRAELAAERCREVTRRCETNARRHRAHVGLAVQQVPGGFVQPQAASMRADRLTGVRSKDATEVERRDTGRFGNRRERIMLTIAVVQVGERLPRDPTVALGAQHRAGGGPR